MYKNIGKKIQTLAKIFGWLLLIAGVVVCLVFLIKSGGVNSEYRYAKQLKREYNIYAIISLVSGCMGYIFTWMLYGFGQLVDDVHIMREKMYVPVVEQKPLEDGWTCSCGRVNAKFVSSCACGKNKQDQ